MRRLFENLRRTTKTLQCNSQTAWKAGIVILKLGEDTTGKAIKKMPEEMIGTIKRNLISHC